MKHNIKVSLVPNSKSLLCQIRLRVTFGGGRVDVNTGLSYDSDKWKDGKPKANTKNQNRQSASEVSVAVNKIIERIDQYFAQCDLQDIKPSADAIRNVARNRQADFKGGCLNDVFDEFIRAHCSKNKIQLTTINMYEWVRKTLIENVGNVMLSQFTDKLVQDFLNSLTDKFKNTSTETFMKFFRCFLKWLNKEKHTTLNLKDLGLNLPNVIKEAVVYLLPDELKKLENVKLNRANQEFYRDVFLFSCYTGLRFSDIKQLRKTDIRNDSVHVVTQKTGRGITIELNKKSREVYNRMLARFPDDALLFPKLERVNYNSSLCTIMKQAEINQLVTITYYLGARRFDITKPKYELIRSHAGRRTFVVNCLLKGIPPLVIIKWTGHHDLSALNPYIAIADEQRRNMMKRFDKD